MRYLKARFFSMCAVQSLAIRLSKPAPDGPGLIEVQRRADQSTTRCFETRAAE